VGETWSGINASNVPGGRLGLVCEVVGTPDFGSNVGGLFVDEVVETVPDDSQTTGVAFHYEEPNAGAPHSILLAIPPDEQLWSMDRLADTVREALDLAENVRTIDPDTLAQTGQMLPALYFAVNLLGATVSTDFTDFDLTQPPPKRTMSVTAPAGPIFCMRPVSIVVGAIDVDTGLPLDGKVILPNLDPAPPTNIPFQYTFASTVPPDGHVHNPPYDDVTITWPQIQLHPFQRPSVSPSPTQLNLNIDLIISATDDQGPVPGAMVHLSNWDPAANDWNRITFPANQPHTLVLIAHTWRVNEKEFIVYPSASITCLGYQPELVSFAWDTSGG